MNAAQQLQETVERCLDEVEPHWRQRRFRQKLWTETKTAAFYASLVIAGWLLRGWIG